ncbi:hypothetical protein A3Q56_01941 [Intoshia linei]|uniref:folate gamma-glutamyl hydrolase n=1 Tax=Intoshia linei TaxID=1819745 RepID=A0A177B7P9_9BILA|nr:hypothetical protein A3Q56_01941 [Intoshia linei]
MDRFHESINDGIQGVGVVNSSERNKTVVNDCCSIYYRNLKYPGILFKDNTVKKTCNYKAFAYLETRYVQFIQQSGAQALPILLNKSVKYYENILNVVNGILLPGGGTHADHSFYKNTTNIILDIINAKNDNNQHFPIMATCLGMEVLSILFSENDNILEPCNNENTISKIILNEDQHSKMLLDPILKTFISQMQFENLSINDHSVCLTPINFNKSLLYKKVSIIATAYDNDNITFISMMEHKKYPYYMMQFHPEKGNFYWNSRKKNIHSYNSTMVSQSLSNFFVNQARKNANQLKPIDYNQLLSNFYKATYCKFDKYEDIIYDYDTSDLNCLNYV